MTNSEIFFRRPFFLWEALYFVLLAAIFAVGIAMRVALPSIPFLDNDSWCYMQPAITKLFIGTAEATFRGFLYPFLLWCLLSIYPDFTMIVLVQHSAGVLAAVILLIAWHRMRVFFPEGVVIEVLHRVGGLVMTAAYLLPYISVLMEHTIRPEAIFPLNIALCIWVATEFSRRTLLEARFGVQEAGLGILLIFFAFSGYYLKPAWGGGIVCVLLPLLVAAFWRRGRWLLKASMFGIGFGLVYSLLTVPEERKHRDTNGSDGFFPKTLFSAHGEIIYDLLKKDTQILPLEAPHHKLLQSLDRAIAQPTRMFYGYTRINPDDILYHGPMEKLQSNLGENLERVTDFCYEYYFRAWKEYPLRMAQKVGVQLWYFYSPRRCTVFDRREELEVLPKMQRSKQVLLDRPSYSWPPFQDYTHKVFAGQNTKQVVKIPSLVILLGSILNAVYFPALVLTLLVALALQMGWFKEMELKRGSLWALYLLSYNFGNSFTIAFIHVMGVTRYHFGQTLFSAISVCFALVFLFSVALIIISRRTGWKML